MIRCATLVGETIEQLEDKLKLFILQAEKDRIWSIREITFHPTVYKSVFIFFAFIVYEDKP